MILREPPRGDSAQYILCAHAFAEKKRAPRDFAALSQDADGMVHAAVFKDGKGQYFNRYVSRSAPADN
jgi:hypothetical protein